MTTTADPQALLLALLDPTSRANPYDLYTRIRERGPLLLPRSNLVVFSTFAECDEVFRHPASSNDRINSNIAQRQLAAGEQVRPLGQPGFLFLDPPDHTRLRRLVSKAFAPKVVKALEPQITTLVDALLDDVADAGTFDVVADLAHPLPVAVICRLLGVPIEDEPEFSRASALLAQSLDTFITFTGQAPEGFQERIQAGMWLRDYLRGLIAQRRREPRDDLISGLVAVEESGDQLTEDEIVSTCNLLLVAGHETTVNLIANAIQAMLHHPWEWAALGADEQRASAVIEETLRYDPPVQLAPRVAKQEMVIGGTTVPKGDITIMLLAAAQRDPAMYERPDEFDPDRGVVKHLAFGHGAHFCLGAPLARLEARAALSAVTRRFPGARLDGEPVYKPNVTLRGLATLGVKI